MFHPSVRNGKRWCHVAQETERLQEKIDEHAMHHRPEEQCDEGSQVISTESRTLYPGNFIVQIYILKCDPDPPD